MKSTGIVRQVDNLGRIVMPIELRRNLGVDIGSAMEIFVDEEKIVMKKYVAANECAVTGKVSEKNMQLADGKLVLSTEGAELLIEEIQNNLKEEESKIEQPV